MRITCDTKDTLPLSALTEFQGGLKKRTADDTNRAARLCELDPHYCDVIRKRWTKWAKENGKSAGAGALK
jgi:hypothetical protein